MRFLVDAQLPPALCGWFVERGREAEHVSQRSGGQAPDVEIAALAASEGLVLVTKDDDFGCATHPMTISSFGFAAATSRTGLCAYGWQSAGPLC